MLMMSIPLFDFELLITSLSSVVAFLICRGLIGINR
jgi:hypothetical protein